MVLNTEWAQVEVIDLINDGSGLAFGIIGGRSTGVVVKTILPGGVADRDGRLQSGDHILQIGDVHLRGLGSEQVASVLRQCGVHVRLVVARPVEPTAPDFQALGSHAPIVPTKLLGDLEELDRHLIENGYSETFCHSSRYQDYIYSRRQSELDVHPLSGIIDKDPLPIGPLPVIPQRTSTASVEMLPLDMALLGSPPPETEMYTVELRKDDYGLGITVAGYVCEQEELSGIFVKSVSAGSAAYLNGKVHVNDRIVQVDDICLQGFTNHQAVELLRNTGPIVKLRLERYLRGPKYEQLQEAIRANQLKPPSPPSPSVSSLPKFNISTDGYSYTEIELEGESHTTMTSSILVDQTTPTNEDAEIVIDNPCPITVLPICPAEDESIKVKWREVLQRDLEIVVAHLLKDNKGGLGISLEGTVDVENGREVRPHHYIRSILPDGPVGANRVLESGDELLEVNGQRLLGLNHLEVVKILKTLPHVVVLVCARHSEHSAPHRIINTSQDRAAFATRSILGGSLQNLIPLVEQTRLVKAKSDSSLASSVASPGELSSSRSKSRSLEPINGLAAWSEESQFIELNKGDRGLGFSILDYQDPVNPNETVIVIRSLVPGGVAQIDGRLIPGDRLLSVNDIPVARASLDKAVQVLKGAPKGIVRIEVAKPLPCNDIISQSSQECNDTENEDHTCVEDYQECLEEYQEGLEVVQICMDESETPLTPLPLDSSPHSSESDSPCRTKNKRRRSLRKSELERYANKPKHSSHDIENSNVQGNIRSSGVVVALDIETKYKNEMSNCLRLEDPLEDRDGYETCLEEVESFDVNNKSIGKSDSVDKEGNLNENPDLCGDIVPDTPEENKPFSKKDHVCLSNDFDTELKSYDDQTDSFGGDQFFLVEYIDDDPNSERAYSSETLEDSGPDCLESESSYSILQHWRLEEKRTTEFDSLPEETEPHSLKESEEPDNADLSEKVTPRRYVRCLSEYYNDYEECLEEYRMYSQANLEESKISVHEDGQSDELRVVSERDFSVDDLSEMAANTPRSCSAPDILDSSYMKVYDPGPELNKNRRKSTVVPGRTHDSEYIPMTVTRNSDGGVSLIVDGRNMSENHWGPHHLVLVPRPPEGGSLGISIVGGKVDLYNAESVLGIFIKSVVPKSPAGTTGELKTGDRILEVDGIDLRFASHEKAVEAIRNAGNPVKFLVQSLVPWGSDSDLENQNITNSLSNNIDSTSAPVCDEIKKIEIKKDEMKKDEIKKDDIKKDDIKKDDIKKDETPKKEETPKKVKPLTPEPALVKEPLEKQPSEKRSESIEIPHQIDRSREASVVSIESQKPIADTPAKQISRPTSVASNLSVKEPTKILPSPTKSVKSVKLNEIPIIVPVSVENSPVKLAEPSKTESVNISGVKITETPIEKSPSFDKNKGKYSDSSEESSDEEDTRDMEGRMYTPKGQEVKKRKPNPKKRLSITIEIDRASAGNVKRTKEEIDADPDEEDEFGYTINKVKKKYATLGGSVLMVQLERGPLGGLGLSLAGHRDRNMMAVFVVGVRPGGAAHRLGPAGLHVGDEILEVNGIVLHGRCHLNASAIIKGLSGPLFKVIILRRKTALNDIAVKPITQFPVTLDDETVEEKYSNFKNVRTVTIKKGTQSLGIMIIEGKHAEVGQGIFISDIQEGSSAEQAGLDIGDMILAVNKDNLVGSSYDTAANLLKKTEGLVVLVVCNPNKKDSTTPDDGIMASAATGAKTPSRPASRPPSAADKALSTLKTSAPPSRPTTPINEPVFDPVTCPIIPGKETQIDILTESKILGFSFVGGKDTLIPGGIIVHEVYPGGAFAKDGRIQKGDQLLEINNEKLTDITNSAAESLIRHILPKVKLLVFRPEKIDYTSIDVELVKKPGKGLGLVIMALKSEPGVYISDILHGSLADVDGRIMVGDFVLSINGTDLTSSTSDQAAVILKTAMGRVSIKLRRFKTSAR